MDITASTFRKSRRCLTVGAALGATLIGVVGCGTGASTASSSAPTSTTSAKPTASPTTGRTASQTGAAASASASDAVTYWVTQVLESHYQRACLASAPGAAPGQDPSKACPSDTFTKMAQSLHNAWAKPGITLPPKAKVQVSATTMPSSDGTVLVPDTTVTVNGQTLRSLELIGASGDTGSVSLSFDVKKVGNGWHVTNWNINL